MAELIVPSRRGFLLGLGAVVASPAVVRAESLMAIKPEKVLSLVDETVERFVEEYRSHFIDAMRYAMLYGNGPWKFNGLRQAPVSPKLVDVFKGCRYDP